MQVVSPISFVPEHVFRHLDININYLYFNELKGWKGCSNFMCLPWIEVSYLCLEKTIS